MAMLRTSPLAAGPGGAPNTSFFGALLEDGAFSGPRKAPSPPAAGRGRTRAATPRLTGPEPGRKGLRAENGRDQQAAGADRASRGCGTGVAGRAWPGLAEPAHRGTRPFLIETKILCRRETDRMGGALPAGSTPAPPLGLIRAGHGPRGIF